MCVRKRVGGMMEFGDSPDDHCQERTLQFLSLGPEPMSAMHDTIAALEVGFDIPAAPGMRETDIQTPCLILDLNALERNIKKMGDYAKAHGMRHRAHAKMHKSIEVAKLQQRLG